MYDSVATHPDKRCITAIRIVTVNIALVVGSTNPVSVGDGDLLVRVKLVGE
jgi:hypothetical protein